MKRGSPPLAPWKLRSKAMTTKPSLASAVPYTLPEVCSLQLPMGCALMMAGYFFFSSKLGGKWISAAISQYMSLFLMLTVFILCWLFPCIVAQLVGLDELSDIKVGLSLPGFNICATAPDITLRTASEFHN